MTLHFDPSVDARTFGVMTGIALLILAACRDLTTRIIPDWISVALAAIGLACRAVVGPGAVATSIALALVLFLLLAFAHSRGGLGGGDVKLLSAAALGLSAVETYHMLIVTAFAGGLLAAVHLVARRRPAPARCPRAASRARRLWTIEKRRWRRPDCLPYGVAIACGGAWAMLTGVGS